MLSLLEYTDYRKFLRQTYYQEKNKNPSLSLEKFATHLGLSLSSFKMILSAKRNLTSEATFRISQALELNWTEKLFFEALVLSNQASEPDRKAYYEKKLADLLPEKLKLLSSHEINHDKLSNNETSGS